MEKVRLIHTYIHTYIQVRIPDFLLCLLKLNKIDYRRLFGNLCGLPNSLFLRINLYSFLYISTYRIIYL